MTYMGMLKNRRQTIVNAELNSLRSLEFDFEISCEFAAFLASSFAQIFVNDDSIYIFVTKSKSKAVNADHGDSSFILLYFFCISSAFVRCHHYPPYIVY
jgi:hypothetical protein